MQPPDGRPDFTDSERAALRKLASVSDELRRVAAAEERWAWLRSTIRSLALAIAAVVTGATIGIDALRALVRNLIER